MTTIYIRTGIATAHCAIGTTGICGTVDRETDKAVCVAAHTYKGKRVTAWFPKKALKHEHTTNDTNFYSLAKWFKANGWTRTFIEITADSSSISA